MKIAVHLGVKDEVELIGPCIDHLRRIGVDQFLVCDMYSTDGTAEILARQQSDDFRIINISNADAGEVWIEANTRLVKECDADWLMFLDADEFPLPATGKLCDVLAEPTGDIITVPRYNVVLGPSGPLLPATMAADHYDEIQLIAKAAPDFRQLLKENPQIPWIMAVPVPKVIVRPQLVAAIMAGGHNVKLTAGTRAQRGLAKGLLIAHVPLSTLVCFERKIENFREFFRHQDAFAGANLAWHWRRWVELAERREIAHEFANSVLPDAELNSLRRQDIFRTAAEMLRP